MKHVVLRFEDDRDADTFRDDITRTGDASVTGAVIDTEAAARPAAALDLIRTYGATEGDAQRAWLISQIHAALDPAGHGFPAGRLAGPSPRPGPRTAGAGPARTTPPTD
jgi:hypothetical protein